MTDSSARDATNSGEPWLRRCLFWVVSAAVAGMLFLGAEPGLSVLKNTDAKDCYYNLLIQGFRAGQLNLKKDVPPGLTQLANPYDPAANARYIPEVGDMSYYKGKLYLYFGVTPAVVFYWPYFAITGYYLQDAWAGLIFCMAGFLAGAGLLYAIWRRYFSNVDTWVAMAGILIFGLMIAAHEAQWIDCRIYEVASSGGLAFSTLALAAVWAALHEPGRRWLWLLLASLLYGLAVAARPSLLFGAIILVVPAVRAWRMESSSPWKTAGLLAAAVGPVAFIAVGLMTYNVMRFGNPLEFGWRYEITGMPQETQFGLHNFWFNLRYFFWEPIHLSRQLPFVRPAPHWGQSFAHFGMEQYYGGLLILYSPVWLALAAPLAWRGRPESLLRWFIGAAFLSFITCALTVCLFVIANNRYELDFLPALMLIAIVGIFALESNGPASGGWKRISRWGWGALAACMVITSVFAGLDTYVTANYFAGNVLVNRGLQDRAIKRFQRALAIEPTFAEGHDGLGNALFQEGRGAEAIVQYQKALEIKPDLAETHYNLGHCYFEMGRIDNAIAQDQIVLKLDPDFVKAGNELASCFLREGRIAEAIAQLEKTVGIAPAFAEAHNNLGYCLLQAGRAPEAIAQFQEAVALNPQSANFRCGLGNALLKEGHGPEAISEYQKAVEIAPGLAGARYVLASGLLQGGRLDDAIVQFRKAVELEPDSGTYHWGLAEALTKKGLSDDAAVEYKKAIELKPDLAKRLQSQTNQDRIKSVGK